MPSSALNPPTYTKGKDSWDYPGGVIQCSTRPNEGRFFDGLLTWQNSDHLPAKVVLYGVLSWKRTLNGLDVSSLEIAPGSEILSCHITPTLEKTGLGILFYSLSLILSRWLADSELVSSIIHLAAQSYESSPWGLKLYLADLQHRGRWENQRS